MSTIMVQTSEKFCNVKENLKIVAILGTKTVAGTVVGHVPCLSDCLMSFSIVATINHGVLQPHGHQQKVELLLHED